MKCQGLGAWKIIRRAVIIKARLIAADRITFSRHQDNKTPFLLHTRAHSSKNIQDAGSTPEIWFHRCWPRVDHLITARKRGGRIYKSRRNPRHPNKYPLFLCHLLLDLCRPITSADANGTTVPPTRPPNAPVLVSHKRGLSGLSAVA